MRCPPRYWLSIMDCNVDIPTLKRFDIVNFLLQAKSIKYFNKE